MSGQDYNRVEYTTLYINKNGIPSGATLYNDGSKEVREIINELIRLQKRIFQHNEKLNKGG